MESKQSIEISVVVPLFNEELNIHELYDRLIKSVSAISEEYELLFVNDGSSDNTLGGIKQFAEGNKRVKYISFSRNFGHQNAIMAGIRHSDGKAIVLIDGDLQDPPEVIPVLYSKYLEGYPVVYARRISRKGESFVKKCTAKIFYRLLKRITSVDIPLDTGDFRIISKQVTWHLLQMTEKNKFLGGQIAWLGFKQACVEYERNERKSGETKFTLRKMVHFAFDGITSFSNFPLQIATFLGFILSASPFFLFSTHWSPSSSCMT